MFILELYRNAAIRNLYRDTICKKPDKITRASKGFSQSDLSFDLKMTSGAYSKILKQRNGKKVIRFVGYELGLWSNKICETYTWAMEVQKSVKPLFCNAGLCVLRAPNF